MLKEIELRQSIRRYAPKQVEDEKITDLLKAAMRAPSARNEQCWQFIVVTDSDKLMEMSELSPYMKMLKNAPCAIVVLGDRNLVHDPAYMVYDCSAAIENLLLEAVHIGLGACWCAIYPNPERIDNFSRAFKLAENLVPISCVALGYSAEEKPVADRFDPAKITYYRKEDPAHE